MIDPGLKNKVVLITGANHGIGEASARALAAQGARVFLTAYRSPAPYRPDQLSAAKQLGVGGALLYTAMQQQPADDVVQSIQQRGGSAAALEADLADPANIPLLFDRCETVFDPVDILVNNHTFCMQETFDPGSVSDAGEFPISMVSAEKIDAHFAINSRAYALMMGEYVQRYLKHHIKGGRIINISTDAAHAHIVNVSYAASKHAIESYSRSAAIELGKYGITVNIIAPGPIQTGYLTPEEETQIAASTPLGRVGRPSDVADVIVFLASQQSHWMTGQLIYVGGGWRMSQ